MEYKELFYMALQAAENAYAPYSGFKVGAAVLTQDKQVYTGINIENSSYGATLCAERTAMAKAISEGHREFAAVAVAAKKDGIIHMSSPCGICRQFIYEFGRDIDVIFGRTIDDLHVYKISELLPEAFNL